MARLSEIIGYCGGFTKRTLIINYAKDVGGAAATDSSRDHGTGDEAVTNSHVDSDRSLALFSNARGNESVSGEIESTHPDENTGDAVEIGTNEARSAL